VLQRVVVCCSVLQCGAARDSVLQPCLCRAMTAVPKGVRTVHCSVLHRVAACCSVLLGVALCCSVLQCLAACCSVLQRVAVSCSFLQCESLSQQIFKSQLTDKCTISNVCKADFLEILLTPQGSGNPPLSRTTPLAPLSYNAVCCSVLQRVAACCSVLQRVALAQHPMLPSHICVLTASLQHTATHCNTLHHTATHSNTTLAPPTALSRAPTHSPRGVTHTHPEHTHTAHTHTATLHSV